MRKLLFVASWLLATTLATAVALGAVQEATEQVSPNPRVRAVQAGASASPPSSGPPSSIATNTSLATSTTTITPTIEDLPTSPPATTGSSKKTYRVEGGTVTVKVSGNQVTLVSAVPSSGFAVEVEKNGPDEVKVEFESDESDSEIRIRVHDGHLEVDIGGED